MATLTVLAFAAAHAADDALLKVQNLHAQHPIALHDAAVVSWPAGKKNPSTRQIVHFATTDPLGGMFWSRLFGLIFFTPLLGMGVGVAISDSDGTLKEYGIDDDFIRRVRDAVADGTSALFLMTSEPLTRRVVDAIMNLQFEMIATTYSEGPGATAA